MYQPGTATDYHDLLNQLIQVATSRNLSAIALTAGGSGYEANEVLNIDNTGSTRTHDAQIQVLTVDGGGAILTARVFRGGAYTVDPTDVTAAATATTNLKADGTAVASANGTGATFDLTFAATGWTLKRRSRKAASATPAVAGSGYNVGNVLTLLAEDSVGQTIAAQFTVATLTGGAGTGVATVTLLTAGLYEKQHSSPTDVATSVAPSGGTGCLLNVTFADDTSQDNRVLILEGSATGAPLVGVRVYSGAGATPATTTRNWSLTGFTGFNDGLTFVNQAGRSPGDDLVLATGGAYVPLRDFNASFPIDFGFTFDNRRLLGWARVRNAVVTHFASFYMGFLNQFGTASEFPYPIYICGTTSRFNSVFSDTDIARMSGLTECIGRTGSSGPGWFRRNDNQWQEVRNSNGTDSGSPSRIQDLQYWVYPCGSGVNESDSDNVIASDGFFDWTAIIPPTGVPGTDSFKSFGAPGTTALHRLIPATLVATNGTEAEFEIKGELDGVYWLSVAQGGIELDTAVFNNERYTIVPNGNRKLDWSYMAIRQS